MVWWTLRKTFQALKSQDFQTREDAGRQILAIGAPAVAGLIELLADRSEDIRKKAIELLGELRDPRALGPLTQAIQAASSSVRQAAAYALKNLGEPRAVPALERALHDSDDYVAVAAASALWSLAWRPSRIDGKVLFISVSQDPLLSCSPELVAPLLTLLNQSASSIRIRNVVRAPGTIGDKRAVEPLIALLRGDTIPAVDRVVVALGQLRDERAVVPLANLWKVQGYRDYQVQIAAALNALGVSDPALVPVPCVSCGRPFASIFARVCDECMRGWRPAPLPAQCRACGAKYADAHELPMRPTGEQHGNQVYTTQYCPRCGRTHCIELLRNIP